MITFRRPTRAEVAALQLRPHDAAELEQLGVDMRQVAAEVDIEATVMAFDGDTPVAAYGIQTHPQQIVPWMLSSPQIGLYARETMRVARRYLLALKKVAKAHPGLPVGNVVGLANLPAQRFLKRLGFVIHPEPVQGFLRFELPHV